MTPSGMPEPYWSGPLSRMVSSSMSLLIAVRASLFWIGGMMTAASHHSPFPGLEHGHRCAQEARSCVVVTL
eukprot:4157975-Prorocentrum_lima.AAC.1